MRQLDVWWRMALLFCAGLGLGACASEQEPPKMASAHLMARSGSVVEGHVYFHQVGDRLHVAYEVSGLAPKTKHGFHLHEKPDCSASDAASAGGHYNPSSQPHGAMTTKAHHAGDYGNILANDKGIAKGELILEATKLLDVQGHSVVIHEKEDDEKSQPAGNSGNRIACGVVN